MTDSSRTGGPEAIRHDHGTDGDLSMEAPESGRLTVAHLGFEDQIAIWALRMVLQGDDAARRVRNQFDRALPAASARIAYDSLERMIGALRRHGVRSLKFHCLCHAAITPDEMALLGLFHTVRRRCPKDILSAAKGLVDHDGIEPLVGATDIFFQALETRPSRGCRAAGSRAGAATVH